MTRATTVAMILLGTAMAAQMGAAQTAGESRQEPATGSPTQIPEIPAGADPMKRRPDPAAGTPAARTSEPPAGNRDADCRVRRADTDTGFVVVCDEGR